MTISSPVLKAAKFVREIISEYNNQWGEKLSPISDQEMENIIEAIRGHSDKIAVTDDPYAEILKDLDSIDAHLHGLKPHETLVCSSKSFGFKVRLSDMESTNVIYSM